MFVAKDRSVLSDRTIEVIFAGRALFGLLIYRIFVLWSGLFLALTRNVRKVIYTTAHSYTVVKSTQQNISS